MPRSVARLAARVDPHRTAARLARSARHTEGVSGTAADVRAWLERQRRTQQVAVEPIPFARLDQWAFHPDTGNLVHHSGRFFTVEGIRARAATRDQQQWCQPIICQPEVGILGILLREFDGVPHLLMQAKMEPGNPGLVQLSPTVQATRSNYTRVHQGEATPYLEHFLRPTPRLVLADALQSEQGSWFLGKRNRNMVVEAEEEVPVRPGFRWLTLGQVHQLLASPNTVNMDSRTVIAHLPVGVVEPPNGQVDRAVHRDIEIASWINERRLASELEVTRLPLRKVTGWRRNGAAITHDTGAFFRVMAVSVRTDHREVAAWTQPMIAPCGRGVVALLVREFGGVRHALVHARVEAGCRDVLELAPTVQCQPDNYRRGIGQPAPRFLDRVLDARPEAVRYRVVQSEEGGRFYQAESEYAIVEAPDLEPADLPPDYRWLSISQLATLLPRGSCVNVQARSLLACLQSLPAGAATAQSSS